MKLKVAICLVPSSVPRLVSAMIANTSRVCWTVYTAINAIGLKGNVKRRKARQIANRIVVRLLVNRLKVKRLLGKRLIKNLIDWLIVTMLKATTIITVRLKTKMQMLLTTLQQTNLKVITTLIQTTSIVTMQMLLTTLQQTKLKVITTLIQTTSIVTTLSAMRVFKLNQRDPFPVRIENNLGVMAKKTLIPNAITANG
jgi:hypothetical protein